MQSLEALPKPFSGFATTLLTACAYTGTGNVLKIQQMLNICYQKLQTKVTYNLQIFVAILSYQAVFCIFRKTKRRIKTKRRRPVRVALVLRLTTTARNYPMAGWNKL